MTTIVCIGISLLVGAGCGYGFRGWITRKKQEAAAQVASTVQNVAKKL